MRHFRESEKTMERALAEARRCVEGTAGSEPACSYFRGQADALELALSVFRDTKESIIRGKGR